MISAQKIIRSIILISLAAMASACIVEEPREGYYDYHAHRYYEAHAWHACVAEDWHCR